MKLELNISPLSQWLPDSSKPVIVSGPCGAETEEQLLDTARQIAKLNKVSIFRAGVWKPRTRPNSFEGVGSIGLQWLSKVKNETGLLTAVEVANAQHVEEALKNEVDILWIGARTTVNPFSVQEIADALRGTDIPVMIKNPVNPDIQLWIGALERINQAGITKLIAIHRGFYSFGKSIYRNTPQWEIPIQLKTIFPHLPVFCDPSHICGARDLLKGVAQKALDLDMDGLMIECHNDPDNALSDAKQQIKPHDLGELLAQLVCRKSSTNNTEFENQLDELRNRIDKIDEEILIALSKRMDIVEKIGEYKRDNNVTILQIERWKNIIKSRNFYAGTLGLDEDFIKKFIELIHTESIRKQTQVMNIPKVV